MESQVGKTFLYKFPKLTIKLTEDDWLKLNPTENFS